MKRSAGWLRLLWPLSLLYSAISRLRVWCYKRCIFHSRTLPGTVISVGNLTVGGTGKTPMVLSIAERLALENKRVAILTRGYRGTAGACTQGMPQSDEVALLRERLTGKVKMGVGADRYKNGEILARHGSDWFVLDDGFQHIQLSRNADIVLIDATDPFGGGTTLPSGRLREPVSALRRADIVVITRCVQARATAIEGMVRRYTKCPIFYATTKLLSVLRVPDLAVALPPQDWERVRVMAFCGIGNPASYFEDLSDWGFQLAGQRSFDDHHVYSAQEITALEAEAAGCGADALLCTEKDVWNLRHVHFASMPAYCCRISFQISDGFWEALSDVLLHGNAGSAR